MDEDESEEGFVDVGFCGGWAGVWLGGPVGKGEAGGDDAVEFLDGLLGVGLEEAGVDLAEDVADGFGFVRELDGEGVFELGVEAGDDLGTESLEVA